MLKLLQSPKLLFQQHIRGNPNEVHEMFLNQHSLLDQTQVTFWRFDALLAKMKPRLFKFFEVAFGLSARGFLSE